VPPALVAHAHLSHGLVLGAEQPVDERALPDPGRSQERHGAVAGRVRAHLVDALSGAGAQGVRRHAGRHLRAEGQRVREQLGMQVELGQHHHGPRAALPGEGQVAFEAARIEIPPQRRAEEDGIDVRRHDLLGHLATRRFADEGRLSRKHLVHPGAPSRSGRLERHPVSHRSPRRRAEARGRRAEQLSAFPREREASLVLGHDPRRAQPARLVRGERGRAVGGPAEQVERRHGSVLAPPKRVEAPAGASMFSVAAAGGGYQR